MNYMWINYIADNPVRWQDVSPTRWFADKTTTAAAAAADSTLL